MHGRATTWMICHRRHDHPLNNHTPIPKLLRGAATTTAHRETRRQDAVGLARHGWELHRRRESRQRGAQGREGREWADREKGLAARS